MQANPLLSIVIPTYNRADLLDHCLAVNIPLARLHNVAIFISDNASIDSTKEIVNKRIKEYPLIKYRCNQTNIGPDENFERALKYPETEYIWLLGDTYKIPSEGINYVIKLVANNKENYDAIVFNLDGRIEHVDTQDFTDGNSLLSSLGALMTCLSCLVFNKNLISMANFSKYRNTYFLQTGIMFDFFAKQNFCMHWVQSISISPLEHGIKNKKPWSMTSEVFNIAGPKWVSFVFLLPSTYDIESKLKCIMDFSKVSGVFSLRHILLLRSKNIFNYKTYKRYRNLFPLIVKYPKFILLLISILPKLLPQSYKKIKNTCVNFGQRN